MTGERGVVAGPVGKRNGVAARDHYHHGALKDALVAAAEAILLESGVNGFTLRAAARRAGVSPSAPAHHFGDAAGLLTEVAARGFEELSKDLRAAEQQSAAGGAAARLKILGTAYVAYALKHPARVRLMFRRDMCDPQSERLKQAGNEAYAFLENAVRAFCGVAPDGPCDTRTMGMILAAWSMVHGFAQLALDGAFDAVTEGGMAELGDLDTILNQMMSAMLAALAGMPPAQ
jgi:AcrR family transcriptional regulator